MLVEMAYADSLLNNKGQGYTAVTQSAVAMAEVILYQEPRDQNIITLTERLLLCHRRDQRPGWPKTVQRALDTDGGPEDFLVRMRLYSNGAGAMIRGLPFGILHGVHEAADLALLQAVLTHGTQEGAAAAMGGALLMQAAWHRRSEKRKYADYVNEWCGGFSLDIPFKGKAGKLGLDVLRAALKLLTEQDNLSGLLAASLKSGNPQSVGPLTLAVGSVCDEVANDLTDEQVAGAVPEGDFGLEYLKWLDDALTNCFRSSVPG